MVFERASTGTSLNKGVSLRRAMLYEVVDSEKKLVRCSVCERRCVIPPDASGLCGNYVNIDGVLYHLGYGRLSAAESRPIEIKPLFHYWPNSTALTFSNWGCNFYCPWCQNHHISFRKPTVNDPITEPEKLIKTAILNGDEGFSASFNEPSTHFDYLVDLFTEARKHNLYAMVVTNGYLTLRALEVLVTEAGVDGWSIDIKGCPSMPKNILPGIDHTIVFRNAKRVLDLGGHVEMVFLVVPKVNDFDECIEWIIGKHLDMLGPKVPLHVNRYYPAHHWREPPTPIDKLIDIAKRARREGIEFVYVGNVHDPELEATRCPSCGKVLIYRRWYRVTYFGLDKEGERYRCPRCGYEIPIRGKFIPWKSFSLIN